MATQAQILAEFRTAMADLTCTRSGAAFVEHPNDEQFTQAPQFSDEAFIVKAGKHSHGLAFGVAGTRVNELEVNVGLGHPPLDYAESTVDHIAEDRGRVSDILEHRTWTTSGIEAVFYEDSTEQRTNPAWVVSTLRFRVVYTGAALS